MDAAEKISAFKSEPRNLKCTSTLFQPIKIENQIPTLEITTDKDTINIMHYLI